ncbi:hypothetical protein [Sporosarcina psychrophila]|uniref:hypothetical protein n=1 Tax=Sporosarcina psychrophila TaxID=1476 RepID=UPI00078B32AE|nr:hypothetical protein [Sporosarcina psychrophila]AMQ07791.1 hypothetical protein AZE41_18595 [Sporosarcina psychrophila]
MFSEDKVSTNTWYDCGKEVRTCFKKKNFQLAAWERGQDIRMNGYPKHVPNAQERTASCELVTIIDK